jgi:hypothetical protein
VTGKEQDGARSQREAPHFMQKRVKTLVDDVPKFHEGPQLDLQTL